MLDERFVFLAVLLNLVGSVHYLTKVLSGHVQPNRASWLLWAIAPAVVFAAELDEGVGLRSVMTFSVALGPLWTVPVLVDMWESRQGSLRKGEQYGINSSSFY